MSDCWTKLFSLVLFVAVVFEISLIFVILQANSDKELIKESLGEYNSRAGE